MTSISTDGHAGSQARSPILRTVGDQLVALSFVITSAVATVGWFYVLAQGAVAVAIWLLL